MNQRTALVILAAGEGKRMKKDLHNDMPKVLQTIRGKSMIERLLDGVRGARVQWPPVIVIGHQGEEVQKALGPEYRYVWQKEQLGTGHAVLQARGALEGAADAVVTLYGDHPFVNSEIVDELVDAHTRHHNTITFAIFTVPDFFDWRSAFSGFSRIVSDEQGNIVRDVQVHDANDGELEIRELNPGYYCIDATWLWENLGRLGRENAQNEYYLSDLLGMAMVQGKRVESVQIEPHAALAANSKQDLDRLESLL